MPVFVFFCFLFKTLGLRENCTGLCLLEKVAAPAMTTEDHFLGPGTLNVPK